MIKNMKKGSLSHPELTKEVIYTEWVVNRLSQKEIAEKYNVGLWLIESRIKRFNLTKIRTKVKYVLNEEHINLESPVFWYLVGLVISDGYIDEKNKRISIGLTNDYEILELLSQYYSTEVKIPIYNYKSNTEGKVKYVLTLSDESLVNLFHSIGIIGFRKTYEVTMPDPGSLYLFNLMLRGFLDGDGNIRRHKSGLEFRFYAESNNLIVSFIELYKKYYNTVLNKYPTKGRNGFTITSGNCTSFLIGIYSELPQLALQRKREIVKQEVDDIVHHYEMINHSNW